MACALHFRFLDTGEPLQDPSLLDFASQAYSLYLDWFGLPRDHPEWPYILRTSKNTDGAYKHPLRRCFWLLLKPCKDPEETCFFIGLTLYERFVYQWPAGDRLIDRYFWLDDLVKGIAVSQLFAHLGKKKWIAYYHKVMLALTPSRMSLTDFKRHDRSSQPLFARLTPIRGFFRCEPPLEYWTTCIELAQRLGESVSWSSICKVVDCKQWTEWYETMTLSERERVKALLELS